jgi:predicted nucleic acid-binding protein
MERITYILDANVILDVLRQRDPVGENLRRVVAQEQIVCLFQPVYSEVMRGLIHAGAINQKSILVEQIRPALIWTPLNNTDWELAARFWAEATTRGKQFSDVDLLMAAVAMRLDAVLVTADPAFEALPIKRENWRTPAPIKQPSG